MTGFEGPSRWDGVDLIGIDFREYDQNWVDEWQERILSYQKELEMSNKKVDRFVGNQEDFSAETKGFSKSNPKRAGLSPITAAEIIKNT